MVKLVSNPILSIYRLKIRTQAEWKVETHILSEPWPTIALMRSRISPAALFVKVMARMFQGFTPFSSIKYAVLWVNTRVFPEPAPARIKRGPSVFKTASFCGSFNVS